MRELLLAASVALLSSSAVAACTGGSGGGPGSDGGTDAGGADGDIHGGGGDSSTTTAGHIDPGPFPATCSHGLAGLNPMGSFDVIEIRVTLDPSTDAGSGPPFTVLERRGTPCATAVDKVGCNVAFVGTSLAASSWSTNAGYAGGAAPPPPRYAYYAVTRGDSVLVIGDAMKLATLLTPIDTLTEAIDLRHGPLGGTSDCPRIRTDPDGYSFLEQLCGVDGNGGSVINEVVTKISLAGAVTTGRTAGPFPDPTGSCLPKP